MVRLAALLSVALCAFAQQVRFVDRLPGGTNRHYVGNRPPLAPSPLMKLPIGAVKPGGWLRKQLELEAEGFSGRLEEISKFCKFQGNAWTNPEGRGEFGWEEVPYWLKGFTDLGYILGDQRIIAQANKWLDAVLATQRENGYFGNAKNLEIKRGDQPEMNLDKPDRVIDLWPNMIMMFPLRSLYEATGDPRIVPFLTKYFQWERTIPAAQFLPGSWQKYRGGDQLDSIVWLYNHTGESWLVDFAKFNHERTANWFANVPTWHGVNISQGFREPGQFFPVANDPKFLDATERSYRMVMDEYGQVPGGMFGADENARPGYVGPRQGAETCSMAEFMLSDEMLVKITGDALWADRAEEVAFNSLPASMTPDLKGLHYLTAPNQVQLDRKNKSPIIENDGDMFSYNPFQYRCCQHNVAHAWPYFAEHLWAATAGDGLAAVFYAPGEVKAKVAGGADVVIREATQYPFDDRVTFVIGLKQGQQKFPLAMRIPGWTSGPKLMVNGKALALPATKQGWLIVDQNWHDGDRVVLTLPMTVRVQRWAKNRDSVSIYRGPLAYSAVIGERWQRYNDDPKWSAYEVFPTTAWNYALVEPENPASIRATPRKYDVTQKDQPWTQASAPVTLKAKARRVSSWGTEANGMVQKVPQSPVAADGPVEEITLVPMGAARLRISAFPVAK